MDAFKIGNFTIYGFATYGDAIIKVNDLDCIETPCSQPIHRTMMWTLGAHAKSRRSIQEMNAEWFVMSKEE